MFKLIVARSPFFNKPFALNHFANHAADRRCPFISRLPSPSPWQVILILDAPPAVIHVSIFVMLASFGELKTTPIGTVMAK